jgi:hypothetical protein
MESPGAFNSAGAYQGSTGLMQPQPRAIAGAPWAIRRPGSCRRGRA